MAPDDGGRLMELPWQDGVKAQLRTAVDSGRLPHAILVSGFPGWGETELCEWLALVLLGGEPGRNAKTMAHPDFRWVAPDGAPIKVDQVRALAEFTRGTVQIARVKVAVIEDAHTMNVNAANALLKTLEEPPGAMHLILGSHSAGTLAPTVRSRCQSFAIPRDRALAADWLSAPAAQALLDDYDGAPLLATRGAEAGERPIGEIFAELADGRPVIDELLSLDPARLSARWARWLARALAGEIGLPITGNLNPRRAFAFADELMWFRDQAMRSNSANLRLLLERLCHHWRLTLAR